MGFFQFNWEWWYLYSGHVKWSRFQIAFSPAAEKGLTRNVSHFLFFDVTWNQIHFKLAFNIEILLFQIHSLWIKSKMRQSRRFISFVIRSLFHSSCQHCCHTFYKYQSCSWTNRAENHPYLRIVILYIPIICFEWYQRILLFVSKSLVEMLFVKERTFMIHYFLCIEKTIHSWLNSRLVVHPRNIIAHSLVILLYKCFVG